MKFLGYGASSKAQKAHEQKTLEEMSAKLKTQEEKNSLKVSFVVGYFDFWIYF